MWRYILFVAILVAMPARGRCDDVDFTVAPNQTGVLYTGVPVAFYSSGLNGTVLSGQSLSLNALLGGDTLARIFCNDPNAFGVQLIVYTNATTGPGFVGAGTSGYLLDPRGDQFGETLTAGRSEGSDGSFSMGLDIFTPQDLENQYNFDLSGVDFSAILPSSGYTITNAELLFSENSRYDSVQFGTAQQLSEPAAFISTLIGLSAIFLAVVIRSRRHTISQI